MYVCLYVYKGIYCLFMCVCILCINVWLVIAYWPIDSTHARTHTHTHTRTHVHTHTFVLLLYLSFSCFVICLLPSYPVITKSMIQQHESLINPLIYLLTKKYESTCTLRLRYYRKSDMCPPACLRLVQYSSWS